MGSNQPELWIVRYGDNLGENAMGRWRKSHESLKNDDLLGVGSSCGAIFSGSAGEQPSGGH
jgi:hypothetical protein